MRTFCSPFPCGILRLAKASHGFSSQVDQGRQIRYDCRRKIGSVTGKRRRETFEPKQKQWVKQDEAAREKVENGRAAYRETMQGVSETVHPFNVTDDTLVDSAQTVKGLTEKARVFEDTARTHSIFEPKNVLKKFRNQFKDLSSCVDFWWLWVLESLTDSVLGEDKRDWLRSRLLPVVYWYQQMEKTQSSHYKKKYKQAWMRALAAFTAHPLTPTILSEEMEQWYAWASLLAGKFHRSSSAVSVRNGCLSQMYHLGRGLSAKRLNALTVRHNFGLKIRSGTTAAERLFGTQWRDLFEWLVEQMGELPLPRKARKRVVPNPLNLQLVPA